MNKIIFFILFLVSPNCIFGDTLIGNFNVTLSFKTNLNFSQKYVLERVDHEISLNRIVLSPQRLMVMHNQISYLVSTPIEYGYDLYCSAGKYTFIKNLSGKKLKESGCMGTERFYNLVSRFKIILGSSFK